MALRGHTGGFMVDGVAAVDMALWDIKGKALGVPIHLLLGGPRKERVACYVSGIRGASDDEKADNLRGFAERRFSFFKLFAGFGVAEDLRLVRMLMDAGGSQVRIALDALWQYDRIDALELGVKLEALDCAWFEAPVDFEDVDGHAKLAAQLRMPIAGGETERTRRQIWPWIAGDAFDIVQPDIGRCGITEGARIISLAAFHNRRVTLHCGIASPMMIAASLQVASAIPAVWMVEYQPVVVAAANRLLRKPIQCAGGAFTLPDGPGLGIEVDEAALRRLALN